MHADGWFVWMRVLVLGGHDELERGGHVGGAASGQVGPADAPLEQPEKEEVEKERREEEEEEKAWKGGLLFYGCSDMFHLSGDNSRARYIKGS